MDQAGNTWMGFVKSLVSERTTCRDVIEFRELRRTPKDWPPRELLPTELQESVQSLEMKEKWSSQGQLQNTEEGEQDLLASLTFTTHFRARTPHWESSW